MSWWPAYLAIGAIVGFLAGLLGIGGGMVMVPMLVFVFAEQGFPAEHLLHLALATAMATIVFTSLSSVRAHHVRGSVDWRVAGAMAPGMLGGALGASLAAGLISTRPLAVIFTALVFYAATQTLVNVKPKRTRELPGAGGVFAAGAVIGGVSSLLAAGGAFLTIPFLTWCNVPLRRAIGTAAANGFPVAVAGSLGYILQGLRAENVPHGSVGYVFLPALVFVVGAGVLTAPIGARVAHSLPVGRLRVILTLVLYALAARMLVSLW